MRRLADRNSLVWLAVLVLSIQACTSWRVQPVEPAVLVQEQAPRKVRITRLDRSTVVLHRPAVIADSIGGLAIVRASGTPTSRTTVALADIRAIAVRRADGLKTAGALFGGGLLAALFVCAATSCMDWSLGGS